MASLPPVPVSAPPTVEGDTTANVGAIPVGSVAHPVDHFDVTAESDIDASSLRNLRAGWRPRPLRRCCAWSRSSGITSATSGASGSVGGGGITITANGDHSADIDAINIAIGAFALGATVAIATNDRSVLATMSASAAMATTGAVLVAADSHDTATAFTPGGGGGGISISVMVPIASVSGATRAQVDGDITSSTSIEVRATGENHVDAEAFVIGLSVFGVSDAVASATIESSAVIEAIVGSTSSFTSSGKVLVDAHHVGLGNKATANATIGQGGGTSPRSLSPSLYATDSGGLLSPASTVDVTTTSGDVESVKVTANGNNEAKADTLIISGGLFSGAGAGFARRRRLRRRRRKHAWVFLPRASTGNGAIVVTATADSDRHSEFRHRKRRARRHRRFAVPTARIGGTTRAEFSGDIAKGDALSVTATGTYDAIASATPVTIGLIAAAGARSFYAEIQGGCERRGAHRPCGRRVRQRSAGHRRRQRCRGRSTADATMNADATSSSISGGGFFTLNIMLPEAKVNGVTRAFVRDGTAIVASSLDVHAGTLGDRISYTATATSKNLAISFVGGTGAEASATVQGTVEAFVGAPAGATRAGRRSPRSTSPGT